MIPLLLCILFGQIAADATGRVFDATAVVVSSPSAVLEIDAGKLKGRPTRLALREDGLVFLRAADIDRWGNERGRNYLIAPDGGDPVVVADEPAWAAHYWSWKSGFAAPGVPALRFDIETREQARTATGSTQEAPGMVNPNNSDPSQSQIAKDVASMQKVVTTTVRLKGHLVIEAVNGGISPGQTFGWAPAPLAALAFVDAKKRLVLVDRAGHKREVEGPRDVLLPAWSSDGKRVMYLQKDKKKYLLSVVTLETK